MAQTSYEGLQKAKADIRPFVITRSGYAGVQRYAMVWTGDNQSTWNNMPFDVQLNLSMGMTGVAFTGCDIGGFGRDCTPELYSRWIEWGVFQPFCRTHSAAGTRTQEPWAFGQDVEAISRQMIGLRMQLLPYIYTAFVHASETGVPINRPLFFDYADEQETHHIDDQFLLGSDLLIAPVSKRGASKQMVYLPQGEWFHYWTDDKHVGGDWITVNAPPGQPPLFVRAGAIIPMWRVRQHTRDGSFEETFLDIWMGENFHGELVEDDGETLAYQRGEELRTGFSGKRIGSSEIRLVISAPQGAYDSPRQKWTIRLRGFPPVTGVQMGGRKIDFVADGGAVTFSFADRRTGQEISIFTAEN